MITPEQLLDNMRALGMPGLPKKPSRIQSQKKATSTPLQLMEPVQVKLLVTVPVQPNYKCDGTLAKRQPQDHKPGKKVYVFLDVDGVVYITPGRTICSSWTIIEDAEEGVHYEFF